MQHHSTTFLSGTPRRPRVLGCAPVCKFRVATFLTIRKQQILLVGKITKERHCSDFAGQYAMLGSPLSARDLVRRQSPYFLPSVCLPLMDCDVDIIGSEVLQRLAVGGVRGRGPPRGETEAECRGKRPARRQSFVLSRSQPKGMHYIS